MTVYLGKDIYKTARKLLIDDGRIRDGDRQPQFGPTVESPYGNIPESGYAGCVSKRFRTCDLNQVFLLPPSLQDWLPENHLARFIVEVNHELDLSKIVAVYGRKGGRRIGGLPPGDDGIVLNQNFYDEIHIASWCDSTRCYRWSVAVWPADDISASRGTVHLHSTALDRSHNTTTVRPHSRRVPRS